MFYDFLLDNLSLALVLFLSVLALVTYGYNALSSRRRLRVAETGDGKFVIEVRNGLTWTRNIDTDKEGGIASWHDSKYNIAFTSLEDALKRIEMHEECVRVENMRKKVQKYHYPNSRESSSTEKLLQEAGRLFMEGKEEEGHLVLDKIKEYQR